MKVKVTANILISNFQSASLGEGARQEEVLNYFRHGSDGDGYCGWHRRYRLPGGEEGQVGGGDRQHGGADREAEEVDDQGLQGGGGVERDFGGEEEDEDRDGRPHHEPA